VSGTDIFAANNNGNTVAEYDTSGNVINAGLIPATAGLQSPHGIAVSGSSIYVANFGNNTLADFTISGTTITSSGTLVSSRLNDPVGVAVIPEPSTWTMLAMGGLVFFVIRQWRRVKA